MDKNYREIKFMYGCTIAEAVLELVEHGVKGEFVKGNFNGHMLYSDTSSIDSACIEVSGETYFDKINKRKKNRQRLIKEEEEYQKTVPSQTNVWIEKGHKILDEKYWSEWDKIVSIRLSDLYQGMELKACLDIIKPLNEGCELSEAKDIIDSQGHSGMSFGLVRNMVITFCDRGKEFAEYVS